MTDSGEALPLGIRCNHRNIPVLISEPRVLSATERIRMLIALLWKVWPRSVVLVFPVARSQTRRGAGDRVATIECDWHGLTSPYGPGALFCCFWFPPSQGPKRAALSQEPETAWRPDQKLTGGVSPLAKVSVYLFASLVLPFRVLPLYVFACNEFLVLHVCN